jgi:transposase
MRPKGSPKELEARRFVALPLILRGMTLTEIADLVGCHPSSVMRWRDLARRGGHSALEARPIPGRPSRLTPRQMRRLAAVLLRGPVAFGYSTDLWTTRRIADVIEDEFGVSYHRDHVGRLMHRLNWSHQKPDRRALQRDEAAIERWKSEEWPRIKKGLRGWAPHSRAVSR